MPRLPDEKNYMGVFTCDVMNHFAKTEFCIVNPGMLRIDFRKGDLTYDIIFEGITNISLN